MTVHGKSLTKYLRISLAGFMTVWLSGVVFLFCCGQMNGQTEVAAASDPMAAMASHCDKARQKSVDSPSHSFDSAAVQNIQTGQIDCCGFLTVVFDKIRKVEKDRQIVAAFSEVVAVKFDLTDVATDSPPPAPTYRRFVRPEKLFIKNCVYRI